MKGAVFVGVFVLALGVVWYRSHVPSTHLTIPAPLQTQPSTSQSSSSSPSGAKISAGELASRLSQRTAHRITCHADGSKRFDYICTDRARHFSWGYDVKGSQIVRVISL